MEVYVTALPLVGPGRKRWMSVLKDDSKSDGRNIWNRAVKMQAVLKNKMFCAKVQQAGNYFPL